MEQLISPLKIFYCIHLEFQNIFKRYLRTTQKETYLFYGKRDTDYDPGQQGYLTYEKQWPVDPTSARDSCGSFDPKTGIFKAVRNGAYLFDFYGKAELSAEVSLTVNGESRHTASPSPAGIVSLTELEDLDVGDEVRMVVTNGKMIFSKGNGVVNGSKAKVANNSVTCTFTGYFVAIV